MVLVLSILAAVGAILIGIFMFTWPWRFWYVTQGWWAYANPKDVRLSDAYLAWNAIQAVGIIFFGIGGLVVTLLKTPG